MLLNLQKIFFSEIQERILQLRYFRGCKTGWKMIRLRAVLKIKLRLRLRVFPRCIPNKPKMTFHYFANKFCSLAFKKILISKTKIMLINYSLFNPLTALVHKIWSLTKMGFTAASIYMISDNFHLNIRTNHEIYEYRYRKIWHYLTLK